MSRECSGRIRYYHDYTDDFVESRGQDKTLPENYQWIHRNLAYRLCSAILYAAAVAFAFVYVRLVLRVRVENRDVLRKCRKTGCFLYGNHTQPMGDAFAPALYCFPRRICTIAGASNLGIPVLGRLLPVLGAIVIPDSAGRMKDFMEAVRFNVERNRCIVIYPESHVWPWCNFIRPFPATAFHFPVQYHRPAFCMTTTYQDRKHGKKPRITVYIDGPFWPDENKNRREQQIELHDRIESCMILRSHASTCEYIRYQKETDR